VRIARVLLACALGASLSVAAAQAQAAAPTAPYNVFTLEGSGSNTNLGHDYLFDQTHGTLSYTPTAPTSQLQFVGSLNSPIDSDHTVTVNLSTTDSTALTVHSYPVTDQSTAGDVAMSFAIYSESDAWCYVNAGTLDVTQLVTDGAGNVVGFAANYSGLKCNSVSTATDPTLSGTIRWASDQLYTAVDAAPRSWDFGDTLINSNGRAKAIRFTNAGTSDVTFGTASLTGATGAFAIKSNQCSGQTVAPGAGCSISVVPHPGAATLKAANLYLQGTGLRTRLVKLQVEGNTTATTYLQPGPNRVRINWSRLPMPINRVADHYRINRGTSKTNLTPLRYPSYCCVTDYSVTPGKTYYYTIQPAFGSGGGVGDQTPVMAADPWPRYSAGMYHHVSPFRLASGHNVVAGHPWTVRVGGQHNVPGSHVSAVVLNVKAVNPSASTDVTVYPTGSTRPAMADVHANRGTTRSNVVIAKVSTYGKVTVATAHGTTPVTIDVTGYFSATGLATSYGQGSALHEYVQGGLILDTKNWFKSPLPSGYYVNAPVNFDPSVTPHVRSLVVVVTAYGSKGSGAITGYATNGRASSTSLLTYTPGVASTNTAIATPGRWYNDSDGYEYPSVSFLNRGKHAVQLKVTIIGFFDDNTFIAGQRYKPSAPVHLLTDTLYAGGTRSISPGSHAGYWTTAMNVKVSAVVPSKATAISMWPRGISGVTKPPQPQLHAAALQTTDASTLEAVGRYNRFWLENLAGRTTVRVYSFGRWDAWPLPTTTDCVCGTALATSPAIMRAPTAARPSAYPTAYEAQSTPVSR
jgi:hypothetical protein